MNYQEFQEAYEFHGEELYNELNQYSENQLLEIISGSRKFKCDIWKGRDQYQIWSVLSEIGTEKSTKILFDIVSNLKIEYLIRYHACAALFKIAKIGDENLKVQVQYGFDLNRNKVNQLNAIKKLEKILKVSENYIK